MYRGIGWGVMTDLLLITDDPRRGERLARDLGTFRACWVHDLYEDIPPNGLFSMVISDVAALTSDAVVRLQRVLTRVRSEGVPYLFLAHGNAARAEAQACLLNASGTLGAGVMTQALLAALDGLQRHEDPSASSVERHAGAARRFLIDIFVPDQPITPQAIDTGTGLVARAVQEAGIGEWVRAVRHFDDATHQHCLLVAGLAAAFAGKLGFTATDRYRLTKAALLHDIGKIQVPPAILNKLGRLTQEEMRVVQRHPMNGVTMLRGRGFEDETLAVVRSHHEMLDGSGYPDGLIGAQIPDLVRLVTVCDIYAALVERRSYKPAMPGAKAYSVLEGMKGRLDDSLVHAFRPVVEAFDPAAIGAV